MSLPSIEALTIGYFLSACTAALTKKDMKPRRTPCSFSKRSWYFFLRSTTGCILTSLKVVRIAAVDCDCTRRSAMRARSRLIGTRCGHRRQDRFDGDGRSRGLRPCFRGGGCPRRLREDIRLGDAAAPPAARDGPGVDAFFLGDLPRRRHRRRRLRGGGRRLSRWLGHRSPIETLGDRLREDDG